MVSCRCGGMVNVGLGDENSMRFRYDWQIWLFILACIALTVAANSCASTGNGSDNAILEHQQQLTELEGRNQELERRLAAYNNAVGDSIGQLEAIRARSTGLEGTLDETIQLFDEYQRAVEQLTRAYNDLQNKTGNSN
jgi:chromosome segregation ATPase